MKKDEQKIQKFDELEKSYSNDGEMIDFTKATWLTSRGNYFGREKMLDESIADFIEAIELKKDHLPAYLGMALSCTIKAGGDFNEGLKVIKKAPDEERIGGELISTKDYILKEFEKMREKANHLG